MSFNSFSFVYGGMDGASSCHPPPFKSPHSVHTHDDDEDEEGKEVDDE
jgi:hypothetical protein